MIVNPVVKLVCTEEILAQFLISCVFIVKAAKLVCFVCNHMKNISSNHDICQGVMIKNWLTKTVTILQYSLKFLLFLDG